MSGPLAAQIPNRIAQLQWMYRYLLEQRLIHMLPRQAYTRDMPSPDDSFLIQWTEKDWAEDDERSFKMDVIRAELERMRS